MTRALDILLSGIALIILTPLMIPVMIGLKLTGEHYIFYEQMRVGKGGVEFPLLKFATMLKDSPNLPGGLITSKNDPRMLPMGKFLRKTKINELPQLINILKGDMSVIGYRPQMKEVYQMYSEETREKIKRTRPGLSGIGSIVFRNEEEILQSTEDPKTFHREVIMPYKGELESWYANHRSLSMYVKLITLTIDAVLHPKSRRWWRDLKPYDIPKPPRVLQEYL